MCLGKLKKIKLHRKVGYKVFCLGYRKKTGQTRDFYLTACKGTEIKPGVWVTDKNDENIYIFKPFRAGNLGVYRTGFHIYRTLNGAKKTWLSYDVICKVEFDDVVATGIEKTNNRNVDVIVARKMKILNEVNLNH